MRKTLTAGIASLAALALLAGLPLAASAKSPDSAPTPITTDEYLEAVENLELTIDFASRESGTASTTLSDGTVLTVGAEPVTIHGGKAALRAALSGWYRLWGNNGLATMEYYVRFAPVTTGSAYTKVAEVDQDSLVINAWAGTTFSGETINIRRTNETSSLAAWVQGRAVFVYGGGLLSLTGGVEGYVKNGVLTVQLW